MWCNAKHAESWIDQREADPCFFSFVNKFLLGSRILYIFARLVHAAGSWIDAHHLHFAPFFSFEAGVAVWWVGPPCLANLKKPSAQRHEGEGGKT